MANERVLQERQSAIDERECEYDEEMERKNRNEIFAEQNGVMSFEGGRNTDKKAERLPRSKERPSDQRGMASKEDETKGTQWSNSLQSEDSFDKRTYMPQANKSTGNFKATNLEASSAKSSLQELRSIGSYNGTAFSTKRSPKSEYVESENGEELKAELSQLANKRELEAIKEDAVKEAATIIDSIEAELDENETGSSKDDLTIEGEDENEVTSDFLGNKSLVPSLAF